MNAEGEGKLQRGRGFSFIAIVLCPESNAPWTNMNYQRETGWFMHGPSYDFLAELQPLAPLEK